jgi:tRNA(Ile)-lysidine synthetase-like protein
MDVKVLQRSIDAVPVGRWAVGVSGGADSVAMLLLLRDRADLFLHVVHLDHETRDGESSADARFVAELCETLKVPCTVQRRSVVETAMPSIASNVSNRYRLARQELFRRAVALHHLTGVLLAHHADDQAETVLMRILRGASPHNLAGMQRQSMAGGLRIQRPLLDVASLDLREFLRHRGQIWREDSSNASDQYQRNRVRRWLCDQPGVRDAMIRIGQDSRSIRDWLDMNAPALDAVFMTAALSDLDLPVARHAALRWLIARGVPPAELNTHACDRLVEMARDAASPSRQHFPGGVLVRRRQGKIFVEANPKSEAMSKGSNPN